MLSLLGPELVAVGDVDTDDVVEDESDGSAAAGSEIPAREDAAAGQWTARRDSLLCHST